MSALFGPAGNGGAFLAAGLKHSLQAPAWLASIRLDTYEYQCGSGVTGSEQTFRAIGEEAKKAGIPLSLHAPYFISLSGTDPEKRLKSVDYVMQSVRASLALGADRIVIHTGSAGKIPREEAMALARDTLEHIADAAGGAGIRLCLETMGKVNQLGTLEEVLSLCRTAPCFAPCVDFGHLNAREARTVFSRADDYRRVFGRIAEVLGDGAARTLHCHFSKIQYTAAGEKKHLTFADTEYGPDFIPFCEAIAKEGLSPRVICESAGTQAEDALAMKESFLSFLSE